MSKTRIACLMLILSLLPAGALGEETPAPTPQPTPVTANYKTSEVTLGSFVKTAQNVGTIYCPVFATAKYEGQTGVFVEYFVRRGDTVEAGQVVATVLIEGSDVSLESAHLTLQRTKEAYEAGREDYDEQLRAMRDALGQTTDSYEREMQRMRVRQLESAYELYRYQQEYSIAQQEKDLFDIVPNNTVVEVLAPISGVVSDTKSMRQEAQVYDGMGLVTIYSTDTVLLTVPNTQLLFRYGMEVTVTTGGAKNPVVYTGRVVAADNVIPQAKRTGLAYVRVEYDPESVDITAISNISIQCETMRVDNALIVARDAVALSGGMYYVTLLEDGTLKKRYVINGVNNATEVWLLGGVKAGDVAVID